MNKKQIFTNSVKITFIIDIFFTFEQKAFSHLRVPTHVVVNHSKVCFLTTRKLLMTTVIRNEWVSKIKHYIIASFIRAILHEIHIPFIKKLNCSPEFSLSFQYTVLILLEAHPPFSSYLPLTKSLKLLYFTIKYVAICRDFL